MSQLEIFYNTISLTGKPFSEARGTAGRQNDRVLKIMKELEKATPLEVSRVYNSLYPACPETSIRRSMTTLTIQGKLEMTDEMKDEKYGKPNHYWKIKLENTGKEL